MIEDKPEIVPHTADSALAHYIEKDESKKSYILSRKDANKRNAPLFPPWHHVSEAMDECQCEVDFSSEIEIRANFKDFVYKTAKRLCESQAAEWDQKYLLNLKFVATTGFDSAEHTNPHQKYTNKTDESRKVQESLLVTNMLLIKLESNVPGRHKKGNNGNCIQSLFNFFCYFQL